MNGTYTDGTITISGGNINNVTTIRPQNVTFEGTTADDFETTLKVVDPTADRTINLADSSGTLIPFANPSTTTISATPEELNFLSGTTLGNVGANDIVSVDSNRDITGIRTLNVEVMNGTYTDGTITISGGNVNNVTTIRPQNVTFEGTTVDDFETTLKVVDPTADRTIRLADSSGTLIPFANPSTTTISATPEELNRLSGTTLGNVDSNGNVSVDSNRDVIGIRNITVDKYSDGTITISGGNINNVTTIHPQNVTFEGTTTR